MYMLGLLFGFRSSQKYATMYQAVCSTASNNYGIETIFYLLDDFLTVDKPDSCTGVLTMTMLTLRLGRLHLLCRSTSALDLRFILNILVSYW